MISNLTHIPGGDWKIWRVEDFREGTGSMDLGSSEYLEECGWPDEHRFDRLKCRNSLKKMLKKR
ncbi:hypothetical protein CCHR01_07308 [Colletotrichum chrysophilum]|uniref:Uncharacterized protein n=1 Tax=Colletotrichum chrysophilum TaxID=1836956 RepID=A0AAD9AMD7_9PEZI|nr:hypothetical protein CCHR01_07308 [Colletotrichum chrysophilum]